MTNDTTAAPEPLHEFTRWSWDSDGEHVVPGTADLVRVVRLGNGGGYDWDEFRAYYSPSRRRYFWLAQSGCSCNSFGDRVGSIEDLSNGARDDLERAIRAWHDGAYSDGGRGDGLKSIDALKAFIEPAEVQA